MNGKTFVTSYINPDLDGVASSIAYAYLLDPNGDRARAVLWGTCQPEVNYFIEKYNLRVPAAAGMQFSEDDRFVVVDTSVAKRLSKEVDPFRVIEIIDHHPAETGEDFPNAKLQNEEVGAAASLVYERALKNGVRLPNEIAILIYGAVFQNTDNLLGVCTQRDIDVINELERVYGFDRKIKDEMFDKVNKYCLSSLEEVIKGDLKEVDWGGKNCIIGQLALFGQVERGGQISEKVTRLASELSGQGKAFVLIDIVDLQNNASSLYTDSPTLQHKLTETIGAKFESNWAVVRPLARRKKIVLALK